MRKHTLLIHHFEETWRDGLAGFDMTPEVMAQNIIDYLHSPRGKAINEVIFTTWEMPGPCAVQQPVIAYLEARGISFEHQVFGYGEVREMYEGQKCTLVQATRYSDDPNQIVLIEDWHRELSKSATVSLCGAFHGECIRDAEDMLTYVRGADGYIKLDDLIVGTYHEYDRLLDCEGASDHARSLIDDYQEKIEAAEEVGDDQGVEKVVKSFKRAMAKLTKDPAFQLVALFPSEEFGSLYSENDDLNEALEKIVGGISIDRKARSLERSLEPSF